MNQSDDRNKSLANYRQNPSEMRGGIGRDRAPLFLSVLIGLTIGFFIAAAVVVLIRIMNNETDGMNALGVTLMVFVPLVVLTLVARKLHKRSKSEGRVSKSMRRFGAVLGLAGGAALWVLVPTQQGISERLLKENMPLIETLAEQFVACRAQIDNYPPGSLKEKITAEQLAELKTVKMNLKRSTYELGEGWNTLITTDTDYARLKPGTDPDEVMDRIGRPKSSFRSPDVYAYSSEFSEEVDELARMAYGEPFARLWGMKEFLEFAQPVRYLIVVRMGEITPPMLTGKQFISGYVSGEAFCFELKNKRLIAAFEFEATSSTKVHYTIEKNSDVIAKANSASHSLEEDIRKNTWPAFWNKFNELASASVSSNANIELPYKPVELDEARLNVLRTKMADAKRAQRVKQGMADLKSGNKPEAVKLTDEQKKGILTFRDKGEKINAIKLYREISGASLLDSKNAVESMKAPK